VHTAGEVDRLVQRELHTFDQMEDDGVLEAAG
jgi:hypothetical protein